MIDEMKLIEQLKGYKSEWKLAEPFHEGIASGLKIAIEATEKQPKVGEWNPVEERLPGKSGTYIVTGVWKGQPREIWMCELVVSEIFGALWCDYARKPAIDAWMPLPAPYDMRKKVG